MNLFRLNADTIAVVSALAVKSLFFLWVLFAAQLFLSGPDIKVFSVYVAYLPIQACLDLGARLYLYRRLPLTSGEEASRLLADGIYWGSLMTVMAVGPLTAAIYLVLAVEVGTNALAAAITLVAIIVAEACIQFWVAIWSAMDKVYYARKAETYYWIAKLLIFTVLVLCHVNISNILCVDLFLTATSAIYFLVRGRAAVRTTSLSKFRDVFHRRFAGFSSALKFGIATWANFFAASIGALSVLHLSSPSVAAQFILVEKFFSGVRLFSQAPVTARIPNLAATRQVSTNRAWNAFVEASKKSILVYIACSGFAIIAAAVLDNYDLLSFPLEVSIVVVIVIAARWFADLHHSNLAQYALTSGRPHFFWSGLFSAAVAVVVVPRAGAEYGALGAAVGALASQLIFRYWWPVYEIVKQENASLRSVLFYKEKT